MKNIIKSIVWPALLVVLPAAPAHADPFLVVPGKSLGQTHLGVQGGADLKRLPKPDGGDAAMGGRRWSVWQSRTDGNTLAVSAFDLSFGNPPHPGLSVTEIRVTSPRFHTQDGLSPGATLAQIKTHYSKGRLVATGEAAEFYTVTGRGIAFEFPVHPHPSTRSLAVSVFRPGGEAGMTAQGVRDDLAQQ